MPELVVYTCSTNNYDNLSLIQKPIDGIRFVFFTNKLDKIPNGWEGRELQSPVRLTSGHDINRFHKLFAHHIFPGYRYSIYIDGNANFNGDFYELFERFKKKNIALAAFRHPAQRKLDKEPAACEDHNKFDSRDRKRVNAQFEFYETEGFNVTRSIPANSILIRDHSNKKLQECMSLWWSHLFEYTKRDQLSLNYALFKTKTTWAYIDDDLGIDSKHFVRYRHARKTLIQKLKGHYRKLRKIMTA